MATITILLIIFIIMLLFPFLFSLIALKSDSDKVLFIDHHKIKDPRYFAKSFVEVFDEKWASYDGSGKINLSKEEIILEADKIKKYPSVCNSLVYAEKEEFRPPKGIRFNKEVYTLSNAYLVNIDEVRAICSKKGLTLTGTKVLRWADAEGVLMATNDCDLGISASSTNQVVVGSNCRFRRVYAPKVLFGKSSVEGTMPNSDNQTVTINDISLDFKKNIEYLNDDITDEGVFSSTIITNSVLNVMNNITVKGHIRSHKEVNLYDGVVIYGNVFAEGNIYLGQNVRVLGSVFTQGNIFAESGVVIGQSGKIKSVIARGTIVFSDSCCVYGYISSELSGECSSEELSYSSGAI